MSSTIRSRIKSRYKGCCERVKWVQPFVDSPSNSFRRRGSAAVRRLGVVGLVSGSLIVGTGAVGSVPAGAAPGVITGVVFRDFDADGVRGVLEPGAIGIGVTATCLNSAGADATVGTADDTYLPPTAAVVSVADGSFSINAGNFPCRVEAMLPVDQPSLRSGVAPNTLVQFVAGPGAVLIGVNAPADYTAPAGQAPNLTTQVWYSDRANPSLAQAAFPSLYDMPYGISGDTNGPAPYTEVGGPDRSVANFNALGAVWGLAYQRSTGTIFATPVVRRGASLPFGPDAVLKINRATGAVSTLTSAVDTDGGAVPADASRNTKDATVYGLVGTAGWGDLDILEDDATLVATNLRTKELVFLNASTGAVVSQAAVPVPACTQGVSRPWGLSVHDGLVYAGVVCDGSAGTSSANVSASVYAYNPGTVAVRLPGDSGTATVAAGGWSANLLPVFALDHARGCAFPNGTPTLGCKYRPWASNPANWSTDIERAVPPAFVNRIANPTPILSDLTFDNDGTMVLSFLDRGGLQNTLWRPDNYTGTDSEDGQLNYALSGDLLRMAPPAASGGTFVAESNGTVPRGLSLGGGTLTSTLPASLSQGLGGKEFYEDEMEADYRTGIEHGETAQGSALIVPGRGEAAAVMMDPYDKSASPYGHILYNNHGLAWVSNTNGRKTRSFRILDNCDGISLTPAAADCRQVWTGATQPQGFKKAAGMASIEALGALAPIEIGNRVWADGNSNGTQDPGEAGVANVTVTLYSTAGTTLATVTTDSSGNYRFSSQAGTDATGVKYGVTQLTPGSQIVIGAPGTATIAGVAHSLTTQDSATDTVDSDVARATGRTVPIVIGAAGNNDHSFDIGFAPAGYDLALAKVSSTASVSANGDDISWTIRVQNQGAANSGAFTVAETLPVGTSYNAGSGTFTVGGTAGSSLGSPAASFTGTSGTFTFTDATGLVPGGYVDIGFTTNVDDITKAPFRNWAEISVDSGADDDSTPDANTGSGATLPNDGYTAVTALAMLGADGPAGVEPTGTTDADDNDDAVVGRQQSFDLALTKTLSAGQSAIVSSGQAVTFTITVTNQGQADASNVKVSDYIPSGFVLADADWVAAADGRSASTTISSLAAGASTTVDITLTAATVTPTPTGGTAYATGGTLTGTVYRDFDESGSRTAATEPGQRGVFVTAMCVSNPGLDATVGTADDQYSTAVSTMTAVDGSYTLSGLPQGICRVEFTAPGSMPFLQPGAAGGTYVQFVDLTGGPGTASVGVNNPADYSNATTTPSVATQVWWSDNVDPSRPMLTRDSVEMFPYGISGWNTQTGGRPAELNGPNKTLATFDKVGTLWGLAAQRSTGTLFGAPVIRRGAPVLGDDLNRIVRISNAGVVTSISPGVDTDPANLLPANAARNVMDAAAYPLPGTIGWGDLDMMPDDVTLVGVNLGAKTIEFIDTVSGLATGSVAIPVPPCVKGVSRPWALSVHDGLVYVGVICDGSVGGATADLTSWVYAYNPGARALPLPGDGGFVAVAGGAWSANVLSGVSGMSLNYTKGCAFNGLICQAWQPWINDASNWAADMSPYFAASATAYQYSRSAPLLTDIEWDNDGSMILGFVDRAGLQNTNWRASVATPTGVAAAAVDGTYSYDVSGDIRRFSPPAASGGVFIQESNGKINRGGSLGGGLLTGNQAPGTTAAAGAGEFYDDNFDPSNPVTLPFSHAEVSEGGLAMAPGASELLMSSMDPNMAQAGASSKRWVFSGHGVRWLNNANGALNRAYTVQDECDSYSSFGADATCTVDDPSVTATFRKASGMADVELLASLAPVEIGNRVWNDANGNGVQDPGEPGIAGVSVSVTDGTNTASVATDANGNYLFSSDGSKTDTASADYGLVWFTAGAGLTVTFPTTTAVGGLTSKDATSGAGSDSRDSDASATGQVTVKLGAAGENNHRVDAGYTPVIRYVEGRFHNCAEIEAVAGNPTDIDSMPDGGNGDTSGEQTGVSVDDDITNGNGDEDDHDCAVVTVIPIYDLALAKVSSGSVSATGQDVTWTVRVQNQGGAPSGAFTVTDTLPAGMSFIAGSQAFSVGGAGQAAIGTPVPTVVVGPPSTVTFSFTDARGLIAGGYVDITFVANVDDLSKAPFRNWAEISTDSGDDKDSTPDTDAGSGSTMPNDTVVDVTALATIAVDGVPAADEDDNDFAEVTSDVASLGNFVWRDINNDGDFDVATETAIDGATVNLYRPGFGPDGLAGTADDAAIVATQATSSGGFYLFTGLEPGDYVVEVATPAGHRSSTGATGGFEGALTPDADDVATDSDDNGSWFSSSMTRSSPVTLTVGGEPTGEPATPGHADTTPDANGNYTVDFGFTPVYAVGNLVWFDAVPDGLRDPANVLETGIAGALVQLFTAAGVEVSVGADGVLGTADDAAGGVTTPASGAYYFDNLLSGDYYVVVTPPLGYGLTSNALANVLNDSNPDPATGKSPNFTLGEALPAVAAAAGDPASLVAGWIDRTIDAGVVLRYSLGNRVWFDADNSGRMDEAEVGPPVKAAERGAGGVVVNLLRADGTPVLDAAGVAVTDTTDASGFYRFDNLLAGQYRVQVAAVNFISGRPLAGGLPSTGAAQEADPNADVDVNDNGDDPADVTVAGIRSGVVTLGPAALSEPTGEAAGQLSATGQGTVDGRANMTVDFGIYVPTYAVGNLVWFDADRDGIQDGTLLEAGVAGAVVKLFRANGTEVPVGPDGVLGTADDAIGGVTTPASGAYWFDDLPAGGYYVTVTPPSGLALTTNAPAVPNALTDSNPDPATGRTPTFTLGQTLPNTGSDPGDPATLRGDKVERTIDAGVVAGYSLGNRVWFDSDNSGTMNGPELGAGGVVVNLLRVDGTPVLDGAGAAITDTTDTSGFYRFDALFAGDYVVEIAASNFAPGGKLFGGHSSTGVGQEADPNADVDVNDNGIDPATNERTAGVRSGVVTLGPGLTGEPTGETQLESGVAGGQGAADGRANMTVDFGIWVPTYSIGNLVWSDFDNDGRVDVGEAPLSAVKVHLLMDDPATAAVDFIDAVDAAGNPVADVTTLGDGLYRFTNLLEGTYMVVLPASQASLTNAVPSGTPNTTPGDDVDGDNNAVAQADGSFRSGPVVVGPFASEPTNEVDGLAAGTPDQDTTADDALTNGTVDFGFFFGIRIGNLVWLDGVPGDGATYDNGVVDPGERAIVGATVELWTDDGDGVFDPAVDTLADSTSTDTEGNYYFTGLTPGDRVFVAIQTVGAGGPLGVRSSTGRSAGGSVADNDDDGAPVGAYLSVSALYTVPAAAGAPTGEADSIPAADGSAEVEANTNTSPLPDSNSDLRLDFGFVNVPQYRLGNLVWDDVNNNGIAEPGEDPLDGVRVELYDAGGAFAGFATTGADGKYLFQNLAGGQYEVRIPVTTPLGVVQLPGYFTSTTTETSADLDRDGNDNGTLEPGGAYWTSGLVTLGNGDLADEPTSEVDALLDGTTDDDAGTAASPDDRSNLTVDFGFYRPRVALGSEVWFDYANDGQVNGADNAVPDGVIVNLLDEFANPVLDSAGVPVSTTTVAGRYLFDDLLVGRYIVELDAANFAVGGRLVGYSSSTGQTTGDALADDRRDHGDDNVIDGVRSAVITLTEGTEPAGENPNQATNAPDTNANMTIDFGIVPTFSLGNEVWIDLDDSGVLDNGEGYVPNGVKVNLLRADGTPVVDGAGNPVSTTTGAGLYLFDNLLAGTYVVELDPSNFAAGGALAGFRSSTLDGIDNQTPHDDNGAPSAGGGIRTGAITLGGAGIEPVSENPTSPTIARDANSDLTIDLGVVPIYALGNQVWIDLDDSGSIDNGESPAPDGVKVNLLHADGTPVLDGAGAPVSTTTTDGKYVFDALLAGSYIVELDASNFTPGTGKLAGYRSSTFTGTDDQTDADDNGAPVAGGAIRSGAIQLGGAGAEPTDETPPSATVAIDTHSDLTVDFGVVPLFAIGNQVWFDVNDSGTLDGTEGPVPDGVVVNLLHADGTPVLNGAGAAMSTTTVGGRYLFDSLLGGDYIVELSAGNFTPGQLLATYRSSTGQTLGDLLADDQHDHGDDVVGDGVRSGVITLALDTEPVGENPQSATIAVDANANMTVDFGIVPTYALGNEVWFDLDDSGALNGTEPYVPDGVRVNLLHGDGSPVLDATGNGLTTTTVGGLYVFDGLIEGDYVVELAASNFAPGGLLDGYRSSTLDASDDQVDRNDNGAPTATGTIRSGAIHLGGIGTEPATETPTSVTTARDTNGDLTVDFGIVPSFSIGNEVWWDLDDSGTINNGEGYVPDGVKVNLLRADGTPVLVAGAPVSTTTVGGLYLFTGLLAGGYIVELDASNFTPGTGLLAGARSSTTNGTDNDVDHDDNGAPTTGGAIRTGVVTLALNTEPVVETPDNDTVTRDVNENLTVDVGVVPLFSLGNQVWIDLDDNGLVDGVEGPVPDGVVVNLLRADGSAVLDVAGNPVSTTTVGGLYLFTGVMGGGYVVEIAASNFAPGGLLDGYRSSSPTAPENATDNDDNGDAADAANPFTAGVRSPVFTLSTLGEPVGESPDNDPVTVDSNENLTVDFGLHRPMFSLGNQVWFDLDDNGLVDAGEPTVPDGTVVRLLRGDGTPVLDSVGNAVTAMTAAGLYLFDGLIRGTYYVEIDRLVGYRSSTPTSPTDSTVGDHGVDAVNAGNAVIRSIPIVLDEGTEPTGEIPDNDPVTPDGNENLAVAIGVVPLLSLGDQVWFDIDGDGSIDAGEPPVPDGVIVNLLRPDGTAVIGIGGLPVVTATMSGSYLFTDVLAGDYIAQLDPFNFAAGGLLEHWLSSPGQTADDTNNVDHGAPDGAGGISSNVTKLTPGGEPTGETPEPTIPDGNENLTVEFGLMRLAVGNRLFVDTDGDGSSDAGEPGAGGVTVELWAADANGTIGAAPLSTTTSDSSGFYIFDGIPAGTYVIRVPATQFSSGAPLAGYISTEGNGALAPGSGNGIEDDDNGTQDEVNGWVQTRPFTIAPGAAPTGETDPAAGPLQNAGGVDLDANMDLTVGFGFVTTPPMSIGSRVWADTDNNGVVSGTEAGIDGVTVELHRDDNADGVPDTATAFQTDVTADGGFYRFTGLTPGKYVVVVPKSNWAPGGALLHHGSSPGSTPANNDTDSDDSGIGVGDSTHDVLSSTVTLSFYDEPTGETQTGPGGDTAADNNANDTIDFGFTPFASVGDFVWIDANRDGIQQSTEAGVDGVTVKLYDANGAVVATTTTAGGGKYLFTDVYPGGYQVEFVTSTLPTGHVFTVAGAAGSDEGNDSDGDPATGRTATFTVVAGANEQHVDLGIYPIVVDLAVVKNLDGELVAGRNAAWRIAVTNKGLDTETGTITVTDTLPAQLTYVSATGVGWTCTANGKTVTCTTESDAVPQATLPAILIVTAVAARAAGEVVNTATVQSSTVDPVLANNASLAKAAVTKGGTIPATGSNITPTLQLGALALALGAFALVGARRRRRPARHSA